MLSRIINKKLFIRLILPFMLGIILWMDWGYFFPLASHNDLPFEVTGEVIEFVVVAGVIGLATLTKKQELQRRYSDTASLLV